MPPSCRPWFTGCAAGADEAGAVVGDGRATGEDSAARTAGGARPIPEISKDGTLRTANLLTACSTCSPCVIPGLVNARGFDDLNVMEGGCITANLATGYAGLIRKDVGPAYGRW